MIFDKSLSHLIINEYFYNFIKNILHEVFNNYILIVIIFKP